MTQPNEQLIYKYEFLYNDIDDGNKEKVAVALESKTPLEETHLDFKASLYCDKHDLGHVTWREIIK